VDAREIGRPRCVTEAVPVDVDFPDLGGWARGNVGIPYVWRFSAKSRGPRVTIQALTHGNEVCGAIAVDWLLRQRVRPSRGSLTLVFANVDAYRTFDSATPFASRCLDDDFNRLWDTPVLNGERRSRELDRARVLRPIYDATDVLLDLHSMTEVSPPLALAGRHRKGVALARALGMPRDIVVDTGHRAGKRLRDYGRFDEPEDTRNALLVECGQHWMRASARVAKQAMLRFLRHCDIVDRAILDAHIDATPLPAQRVIDITDVVTIESPSFSFVVPVHGMMSVPKAGTLLAHDGGREIRTPYDDCVLLMPAQRPKPGETAVRLGRYVE
jgi:predicted deacylase